MENIEENIDQFIKNFNVKFYDTPLLTIPEYVKEEYCKLGNHYRCMGGELFWIKGGNYVATIYVSYFRDYNDELTLINNGWKKIQRLNNQRKFTFVKVIQRQI
jgi:hypothetical protein